MELSSRLRGQRRKGCANSGDRQQICVGGAYREHAYSNFLVSLWIFTLLVPKETGMDTGEEDDSA